eukprot:m.129683 g.129683  ORF g.129683 m.129683 type:complete len:566 (+) comp37985_c0_seq1:73-1770(+)
MADGKLPADGWSKSLMMVPKLEMTTIDEYLLNRTVPVDGREVRAQKGRSKGWILWRNDHVRNLLVRDGGSCTFVKAEVKATMKTQVKYSAWTQLNRQTSSVRTSFCYCKAGGGGCCKHAAALLFRIWDLKMQNLETVPADLAITEIPAYWRQHLGPVREGPLLFDEMAIVKHKPPNVGASSEAMERHKDNIKVSIDRPQQVIPDDLLLLSRSSIEGMSSDLENEGEAPMLAPILKGNRFVPVYAAADVVKTDHSYGYLQPCCTVAAGPPTVQWSAEELVPLPCLANAAHHLVVTMETGGCLAKAMPPIVQRCDVEDTFAAGYHDVDLSQSQIDFLRKKHICLTSSGCQRIEAVTRTQRENEVWHKMRSLRLTASNFGRIVNRRKEVFPKSILDSLFAQKQPRAPSLRWGIDHELSGVSAYESYTGLKTSACGLFISPKCCWLGASPDRIVIDEAEPSPSGLVEVKCPFTGREMTVSEFASKCSFLIVTTDGNICLKRQHAYYYQVLGQMGVAERKWCDFTVWTKNDIHVERIYFNNEKWQVCVQELTKFFFQFVVVDERYGKQTL